MATSITSSSSLYTKFIMVYAEPRDLIIVKGPPSNHSGSVYYLNYPSGLPVSCTKMEDYSRDIESELLAARPPYTVKHIEFTANDDGTSVATARFVDHMEGNRFYDELAMRIARTFLSVLICEPVSFDNDHKRGVVDSLNQHIVERWVRKKVEIGEVCVICQQEYQDNDGIFISDCNHRYHWKCLCIWLEDKDVCPICRAPIFSYQNLLTSYTSVEIIRTPSQSFQ